MTRRTATLILAILSFASSFHTLSAGIIFGETMSCTHYAKANTESAICGDGPNAVCSQKCTGGVVIDGCSSAQQSSAPLTRQTCTISFSQTSTTNSLCVNAQGSFSCSGVPTGQATCSGCVDSQLQSAMIQSVSAPGALGRGVATVVPAVTTSSTPSTPIVSQNRTANTSSPISVTQVLPVAQVAAETPVAAQSTQPAAVVSSPPNKTNNTTSSVTAIPASQDEAALEPEDDNTTSTASSLHLKNLAPLIVTLGFTAVGAIIL